MYSNLGLSIGESATIKVADAARKLKREGKDVISFAVGEPDFDTPQSIKEAGKAAIDAGYTKYTDLKGIKPLREKIAAKLLKDNNLSYSAEQIIVGSGAKHSLYNALCAILNPGEEVIVIAPAWVSYVEQIKLLGGVPKIIKSDDEFNLPHEKIKNTINSKTKAIIINSPSNPTGKVYKKSELEELAEIIVKHDNLFVISDEIYEKIIYNPARHYSIASFGPKIKEKTILINGFSKAYSMTGWRMGYVAAKPEIAKLIANIQSHMTSCPNSISQYASLRAIELEQSELDNMVKKFEKRKYILKEYLDNKPELKYTEPEGAFYFFVDFSYYIGGKVKNSLQLSLDLLQNAHIALTAGSAFFKENYLRISYATDENKIKEGLKRLDEILRTY
ncbi:MAG: pyridoxal phosphate-dependent aminotransferase [Candidatus Muiribacteriota bacterium]